MGKRRLDPQMIPYLQCLVNPSADTMVRIPDGYPNPTALVHSRQIHEVFGNTDTGANANRFFWHFSPTLVSQGNYLQRTLSYSPLSGVVTPFNADIIRVLGCAAAEYNPAAGWDPSTSFQSLIPAVSMASSIPQKSYVPAATGYAPLVPPLPPSVSSYTFYADPNAATIGGSLQGAGGSVTYYSNGFAECVRPVAMSVWFQCTQSALNNGGDVSACLMPPASTSGSIIPYNWDTAAVGAGVWAGQGPVQNWENLAQVPVSYTGKLKDGTYTYWLPFRVEDLDMGSVSSNLTSDFPTIVVSGQAVTPGLIGKIIVETVYQYSTVSQVPSLGRGGCVPNVLEEVKCALYGQPTSMANGSHKSWIKWILTGVAGLAGGAAGFLVGGPPGMIAAGSAAAGAMKAAL